MFDDDLDPKKKKPQIKPLDGMSVPELNAYLSQLKEEQTRVEAEIAKKENYKSRADSFFKTS